MSHPAGQRDADTGADAGARERTTCTDCCIVGGGPAGAVLALLLARQGIPVVLLEEHKDFDRDFRGDTIHPSVMQIMEELGLAERLLALSHGMIQQMVAETDKGPVVVADFQRIHARYPFIAMVPQVEFLNFITHEAAQYPTFHLVMGARVEELIEEEGRIRGVRYRGADGVHTVRARLTVGADGRFSRVRRLAGFATEGTSPPMDVLWFRVPRQAGDPGAAQGRFGHGATVVLLNRNDSWQVAFVIPKGGYSALRARGIEAYRELVAGIVPEFAGRLQTLQNWKQVSLLSVESSRVPRWYRRGLLLIGDAAHVMSPVGGVGINYAIQDAVVASNVLAGPLKQRALRLHDLAEVQRRRELPTRVIQAVQAVAQKGVFRVTRGTSAGITLPWPVRLLLRTPILRDLPARMIAYGIGSSHVKSIV